MLKRILIMFSALIVLSGGIFSFSTTSHASTNEFEDLRTQKKMTQVADEISSYFSLDENDNLIFSADRDTLINLGVSEEDADLMILAAEELTPEHVEAGEVQAYGFVGLYVNLGPKVRAMNGWAAGAFTAGYVGWYAKQFAINPVTAGVAAVITAGTALAAKNAVENNLRKFSIGLNIPLVSMSYNVYVP